MVWGLGVNPQKLFFSGGEGSPFQNLERLYAFIYAIFFIFLNEMFMLFAMFFFFLAGIAGGVTSRHFFPEGR